MQPPKEAAPQIYQNIMEDLVMEEINKQLKHYPSNLVQSLNKIDVATYALNRLPPLYACTQKGKNQQKLSARNRYREQIIMSVRQGIAAVQRDPIRSSIPLLSESCMEYQIAEKALQNLAKILKERNLLEFQELNWDNLVIVVQKALNKMAWLGMKNSTD
jgi:hypothetical protein